MKTNKELYNISNNNINNIQQKREIFELSNKINKTLNLNNKTDNNIISINQINLLLTIEKDDINKDIYFLYKDFSKELNDSNAELFINQIKYKYNNYFKPEKEGIYNIKIKINKNITDCSHMFSNCKNITNIDLSPFDAKNVINMESMFEKCENLTNINLSNFNTKNVTNMMKMFFICQSLTNIDLSSFDTKNVTNMKSMFELCINLINVDLTSFDTTKLTDMENMFYKCENLENINLSSFDTKNVTNMRALFLHCEKLKNIDVTSFDTKNVINNMQWMFSNCMSFLNIDVSSFNTINVTNMSWMFSFCNFIDLDLSNFNTINVTSMENMFYGCGNLVNINISNFVFQKNCGIREMFPFKELRQIKLNKGINKKKILEIKEELHSCGAKAKIILV